ncbi:hypothetical protein Plhal703r1_c17g0078731 [Plasmopara halstedii]
MSKSHPSYKNFIREAHRIDVSRPVELLICESKVKIAYSFCYCIDENTTRTLNVMMAH